MWPEPGGLSQCCSLPRLTRLSGAPHFGTSEVPSTERSAPQLGKLWEGLFAATASVRVRSLEWGSSHRSDSMCIALARVCCELQPLLAAAPQTSKVTMRLAHRTQKVEIPLNREWRNACMRTLRARIGRRDKTPLTIRGQRCTALSGLGRSIGRLGSSPCIGISRRTAPRKHHVALETRAWVGDALRLVQGQRTHECQKSAAPLRSRADTLSQLCRRDGTRRMMDDEGQSR